MCAITPKHLNYNNSQNNLILSNSDVRKNAKTPLKTPLKLSSAKKKTPHTITDDRYIPNRTATNMEASYHLLINGRDQENIQNIEHLTDSIKRKIINDTCQGVINDKDKVLHLRNKPTFESQEQAFAENIKVLYSTNSSINNGTKKIPTRIVQSTPEKILDAPDYRDDFCKFSSITSCYNFTL